MKRKARWHASRPQSAVLIGKSGAKETPTVMIGSGSDGHPAMA
jgi:hypothetical protein